MLLSLRFFRSSTYLRFPFNLILAFRHLTLTHEAVYCASPFIFHLASVGSIDARFASSVLPQIFASFATLLSHFFFIT